MSVRNPIFRCPPLRCPSSGLLSKRNTEFLAPIPSHGRTLSLWKISGLKSLGLCSFFVRDLYIYITRFLAWLPLQSLAVKKKNFFVQILGGEKLLEKCR